MFLTVRFGGTCPYSIRPCMIAPRRYRSTRRSEEHTSELQSQSNLVCRLLLEKKKIKRIRPNDLAVYPIPTNQIALVPGVAGGVVSETRRDCKSRAWITARRALTRSSDSGSDS